MLCAGGRRRRKSLTIVNESSNAGKAGQHFVCYTCVHECVSSHMGLWVYTCMGVYMYTHVCAVSLCMCSRVCIYCYECVYICVYTCVYEYVCIQIVYVYTYVRMNLYMCMCLYMCVWVYLLTCVYLCISMHMYLFTCGCLYLYLCIYVYIVHCVSISVYILAVKNLDNRTAKSWVQDSPIIIVWPWGNFLTSFSFNHFIFRLEIITHASEIVLRGI